LLCVLNFRRSGGALRWAVAAGALGGVAALTRNTGFPLILALPLGVWTMRPRFRPRALLGPVLLLGCAALVIAPWTLRNADRFGRFIPVTTSAGITASGVYNATSFADSKTNGAWRDPQIVPEFRPLFVTPGIDEGAVNATLQRKARDFAWQHPGYVAEVFGWNLLRLFEIAGGSVVDEAGHVLTDRGIGSAVPTSERAGLAIAGALALIGVFAIFRSVPRGSSGVRQRPRIPRGPLFLWLVPILIILTTAPLNGLPRDRLPTDPFLLILAAIGLTWLWHRFTGSREAAR
jgi:4-amino-4-deoxy-L-arabinose transferase-like glycosyltransferase